MEECLSTACVSILVNGGSSDPFNMNRGVRQGDALSPFPFLITVEGLKCIIDKAKEVGLIDCVFISESLTTYLYYSLPMTHCFLFLLILRS